MQKVMNLIKPHIFIFYYRQLKLKWKYGKRLQLSSWKFSYSHLSELNIDRYAFLSFGNYIHLAKGVNIEAYNSSSIIVGDNFFINKNSSIIARNGITIGNDCMIGEHVTIIDHNHTFDDLSIPFNQQGYTSKAINIGNNVWIGSRVFIGMGVTIGDNVVIGSNTVLTKSVPSNSKVYSHANLIIKPIKSDVQ